MKPFTRALVRVPSARIAEGLLTHQERVPVDAPLARAQHAAYVDCLRRLGLTVFEAPEAPDSPDGVFVEDVLVVIEGRAILTRPGAPERRAEVDSVEPVTRTLAESVEQIVAPGRLDGGDVLVTRDHVLVGRSSRSNQRAADQLAALGACRKRKVISIEVECALHLKTILTALPDGSLLAAPGYVDTKRLVQLGYTVRQASRLIDANVLSVNGTVVMPASATETSAVLRELGMSVTTVDISELQKLEAGVSCLSVLF